MSAFDPAPVPGTYMNRDLMTPTVSANAHHVPHEYGYGMTYKEPADLIHHLYPHFEEVFCDELKRQALRFLLQNKVHRKDVLSYIVKKSFPRIYRSVSW